MGKMGGEVQYSVCWPGPGGNSVSRVSFYKIDLKTVDIPKVLFAEELAGTYQNQGPRMIFLGEQTDYPRTTVGDMTHMYARLYEVSISGPTLDDVFTGDKTINTFWSVKNDKGGYGVHPATVNDTMVSVESGVTVK